VQLNGLNPGQFAITGTNCITTLPVGGTCTINVVFRPTAAGAYSATLTIRDNVNGPAPSSALSGTGL
jgi:hypothetical protein